MASHYVNQHGSWSFRPYGITRPQWIKSLSVSNVIRQSLTIIYKMWSYKLLIGMWYKGQILQKDSYIEDMNLTQKQLDMSTACRRLKSPRSLSGTSAHPTMVTQVNIMVMHGWLASFLFIVNRLPHSWDKAISDSDLETLRSRSWVWSKGKVIQLAQYHINSLPFHLTSIRPTILQIELFRNLTLKHPRSRTWGRS